LLEKKKMVWVPGNDEKKKKKKKKEKTPDYLEGEHPMTFWEEKGRERMAVRGPGKGPGKIQFVTFL